MKPFSFPKSKRLVSTRHFRNVLEQKRCSRGRLLNLYIAANDCGYSRLGISVRKTIGNAVERNRIKRLMREAFRQNQVQIPAGYDYLLMISRSYKEGNKPDFKQFSDEFLSLVRSVLK